MEKTLPSKHQEQYFKANLYSISDWKQFETPLQTLPWKVSNLDMKDFKEKPKHSLARFGIFISSLLMFPLLSYIFSFIDNFYIIYSLFIGGIIFISLFLSEGLKMVDKLKKPIISIEKDQIVVFMPYKGQKVILVKHKIEEIKLIPKEGNNYNLQVSFKNKILFFSMNLNEDMLINLTEILTDWSDTIKIDLSNYNNFKINLPNNPKKPFAAL